MQLTFLNLTNAPNLNPAELKVVRGHVTKSNFARRRVRLRGGTNEADKPLDKESRGVGPEALVNKSSGVRGNNAVCDGELPSEYGLLPRSLPAPDREIRFLLTKYRPLVFPTSLEGEESDTPHASKWFTLMRSEQALVEASMAIAIGCGSNDSPSQFSQKGTMHTYRAVKIISRKLSRGSLELTDGLLAAVFTLSYSELLRDNPVARESHVAGLAEMVKLRSGQNSLPKWLADFLVHDSIGAVIISPDEYCTKVAVAIGTPNSELYIRNMAKVSKMLAELRELLDGLDTSRNARVKAHIGRRIAAATRVIDSLPKLDSSYLQALEYALRLYLALLWPPASDVDTEYWLLGLKDSLGVPKVRLCAAVHLTAWQLFVGAASAGGDLEMKAWFMARLKRTLASMRVDSWERLLVVFSKTFMPDMRLLAEFEGVWNEVVDPS
ncbi:fungal specific transcription factor domain-containing protein [Pochonia chlamydosporia 170]|uniref:Fungal specific transcription factor domain-containing protein n=1 Tax=Pochonia chlamydosporia 170 TaxID=1380566 RepID=A0A179G180_METCM|nr:fungal specific transcription factor domain-containing protein [Pochonia chlamydosporia 170]OAQ71009.1 fungal specific transcription factor domain-containing protein [Pochonia chlamydosporia 170]